MKAIFTAARLIVPITALYTLSALTGSLGPLFYAAAIPIAALPAAASLFFTVTLKKRASLSKYSDSLAASPFVGRAFSYVTGLLIFIFLSAAALVRLYTFSFVETVALCAVVPGILIGRRAGGAAAEKIYKSPYLEYKSRTLGHLAASFLSAALYSAAIYFPDGIPRWAPLSASAYQPYAGLENNPIAYWFAYWFALGDNVSLGLINGPEIAGFSVYFSYAAAFFLGNGILFYFIINFIEFFSLKKVEILSIFRPLKDIPDKRTNGFVCSFVAVLCLLFIYPNIFAAVQTAVRKHSVYLVKAGNLALASVEMINGTIYKEGTLKKIREEKLKYYGKSKDELKTAVNEAYDEMINNCDGYLDWYYGLPAEYERLAKMLAGSFETYITENLTKRLAPEKDLTEAWANFEKNSLAFEKAINDILRSQKAEYSDGLYTVVLKLDQEEIYAMVPGRAAESLKKRLGISSVGATAAAAAAGKLAAKTGFKTASKALAKLAAKKAVGTAAATAAGAAAGFLTSPVGGVAAAIAVGTAIDGGLLKLEETLNRDGYKAEITNAINEARAETCESIDLAFRE